MPDHALRETDVLAAEAVGELEVSEKICFVHTSGALPSGCLGHLTAAGCSVGSMHPLQSFGEASESAARLDRTLFSVEGDEKAVASVTGILEKTGARVSFLTAEQKPLYHAGACVVSNYLVTLVDSGLEYFEAAGISRAYAMDAIFRSWRRPSPTSAPWTPWTHSPAPSSGATATP